MAADHGMDNVIIAFLIQTVTHWNFWKIVTGTLKILAEFIFVNSTCQASVFRRIRDIIGRICRSIFFFCKIFLYISSNFYLTEIFDFNPTGSVKNPNFAY